MKAARKPARRVPNPGPGAPQRPPGPVAEQGARNPEDLPRGGGLLSRPSRVASENESPVRRQAVEAHEAVADRAAGGFIENDVPPAKLPCLADRGDLDELAIPNRGGHALPHGLKSDGHTGSQ